MGSTQPNRVFSRLMSDTEIVQLSLTFILMLLIMKMALDGGDHNGDDDTDGCCSTCQCLVCVTREWF